MTGLLVASCAMAFVGPSPLLRANALVQSRFEDSNGEFRSFATGGSGKPLLVLAGGPGFGFQYLAKPLVPLLGDTRQLIFLDPSACPAVAPGTSRRGCRFSDYVDELEELRIHLKLDQADILAHAFGGLVAIRYASSRPQRVERLVLDESDPATRDQWAAFRATVQSRRKDVDTFRLEQIDATPGWERNPDLAEEYIKTSLAPYFGREGMTEKLRLGFDENSLEALRSTTEAVRTDLGQWDFREEMARISIPVFLLYGSESVFSPSAVREMHRLLKASHLEILPGVGHFPFLEAPDRFRALVSRFLEGH